VLTLALAASHRPRAPEPSGVPAGLDSGATPAPGLLQLEVKEEGRVELVNRVTLHLPPAQLERHAARRVRGESGRRCLKPPPRTVRPCLEPGEDEALVLTLQPEGTRVRLQRVKAP
jgi:hypothetical protein